MKFKNKKNAIAAFIIFIASVIFLSRFIIHPELLLLRNNDLTEFTQSYLFFKEQIIENHQLPLWQNRILSGSPYLGDPQNPLLYLPNYLVLIIPLTLFLLFFFLLHYILACFGAFFFARQYNYSYPASLFVAIVYSFSPLITGHLEDGHINMMAAFAWFPWLLLGVEGLLRDEKRRMTFAMVLGFSAASMFINYVTIFVYGMIGAVILAIVHFRSINRKVCIWGAFSALIFLFISLPQIIVGNTFLELSTRNLITLEDVGPVFMSIRKFFESIISPYTFGLSHTASETTLTPGVVPLIVGILGIFLIKKKLVLLLFLGSLISIFFALNTKIPIYADIAHQLPLLMMFRISTRFWFIVIFLIAFLGGHFLQKKLSFKLQIVVTILVFLELFVFASRYFDAKSSRIITYQKPSAYLESILKDTSFYRIYCTNGCPSDLSNGNNSIANGYNPVQLSNYFDFITKAGGYEFNSYALSIPPYQTYVDKPQPDSVLLGLIGVKYVFSSYPLIDKNFIEKERYEDLTIYENEAVLPRAFTIKNDSLQPLSIIRDNPGKIEINVRDTNNPVYINDVYMPFWIATNERGEKMQTSEYKNILIQVDLKNPSQILTVKFKPPFIDVLIVISFMTSLIIGCYILKNISKFSQIE